MVSRSAWPWGSLLVGVSLFVLAGTSGGDAGAPPLAVAPFDAEDARAHQAAWAEHLGVAVEVENSIGMKLVLIPPGEFMMGSPESERERAKAEVDAQGWSEELSEVLKRGIDWEGPQHRVRLTKPFYLGKHVVTVGEFRAFVEATNYETDAERDGWGYEVHVLQRIITDEMESEELARRAQLNADLEFSAFAEADRERLRSLVSRGASWRSPGMEPRTDQPVLNVSWNDAIAFCKWLSEREGREYRLPTEAEWEYACRAGTTTRYFAADSLEELGDYAWYDGNSGGRPHRVGQKLANAWGLFDMHGNVFEWCSDWYSADYYANSPLEDPTGPESGSFRVGRGGSWVDAAVYCRSAYRSRGVPAFRISSLGFRIALSWAK